jgi:CRISPR-associated protein Csd1
LAEGGQLVEWSDQWQSNDLFAFVLSSAPDAPVHQRPAIVEYWRKQRALSPDCSKAESRCLVTGMPFSESGLFPMLKKLPGGGTMGTSLVSFNAPAFLSHGWKSNENAPISREAAETCATALNRLLHPAYPSSHEQGATLPERRYVLTSDTVVVFWSPEPGGQETCDWMRGLLEPSTDPAQVSVVYQSIWRGMAPKLENPAAFYAMTLTGTTGRAIVRDWLETTVGKVLDNVAQYFADIDLVRNTPKPKSRDHTPALPLNALLRALAVHGDKERLPPNLAAELFHVAVTGAPFPRQILQRAIERWRAESNQTEWFDLERRDARAALVKAYLNRQRRFSDYARNNYPEVNRTMDPNNTHPGYLLGRLMAVLERLQQQALGNVNATVVDRYFKRAVAAPRTVFTHLLKLRQSHERKLRRDKPRANVFLQKRIDGLLAELPGTESFPRALDLESQGLFLLGYHHERHWLWMNKEARESWAREHGIESTEIEIETIAAE